MNRAEFDLALRHLQRQAPPLILPYAARPGESSGGDIVTFTSETWASYQWNPPGTPHYAGQPPDPAASPKPTWAAIQAALPQAELEQSKEQAIAGLRSLCHHKIIANYGAKDFQGEVYLRLRNGHTAAQDTERDRLKGLFQAREVAINAATTTAAVERLRVAATADSFWVPPPVVSPRRGA